MYPAGTQKAIVGCLNADNKDKGPIRLHSYCNETWPCIV